ncbi:hypothetical protein Amsp01_011840 [Amycolatopsis sp. NBRC 101858]|nr:hypothetical protein Amsp01_011840 [Amycolatopsis sp. NBRC 101858]
MQLSDSGVERCELPYTVLAREQAPPEGADLEAHPDGAAAVRL